MSDWLQKPVPVAAVCDRRSEPNTAVIDSRYKWRLWRRRYNYSKMQKSISIACYQNIKKAALICVTRNNAEKLQTTRPCR